MEYDKKKFSSPEKYIEYLQMVAQDALSLNAIIYNKEGDDYTELGELIPDPGPSPEEIAIRNDDRSRLLKIMEKHLSPREYVVMNARFGLDGTTPMTLAEVGIEYGLSRERIRQIEFSALKKLRKYMNAKNLTRESFWV